MPRYSVTHIISTTSTNRAVKSEEHAELLQLGKSGIRVATYLTELPTRTALHKQIHQAVLNLRARLESERASDDMPH